MKITNAHQFYKDVFTTPITPIHIQDFTKSDLAMGVNSLKSINEVNNFNFYGLDRIITLVNFSRDSYLGKNFPDAIKNYITLSISVVYRNNPSLIQKIICAKSLFRIGAISHFESIVKSDSELSAQPDIKVLCALIHTFEEDYEKSAGLLADVMDNPHYKNHFLFKIMMLVAFYKCGGIPELPLDLTPLIEERSEPPVNLSWVAHADQKKTDEITVFTASDPHYFKNHALSNFLSYAKVNDKKGSYHFHLYNPDQSIKDAIKKLKNKFKQIKITATEEYIAPDSPHIKASFTINRFRALYSIQKKLQCPIMAVDADSLWRKPISLTLNESQLSFCGSPHSPFWENNLGGACFFNTGEISEKFLGMMSKFITNIHEKGQSIWFQDQVALKITEEIVSKRFPSGVSRLDANQWYDTTHMDSSILWQVTTRKDGEKYNTYKSQLNSLLD